MRNNLMVISTKAVLCHKRPIMSVGCETQLQSYHVRGIKFTGSIASEACQNPTRKSHLHVYVITHCGIETPYGAIDAGRHPTAQSHYPNQHRLTISEVLWHWPKGNFAGHTQDIYPWYDFENYSKITAESPRGRCVNMYLFRRLPNLLHNNKAGV